MKITRGKGLGKIMAKNKISVVVPVYYNSESLPELYSRICKTFGEKKIDFEIILVDDGSGDASFQVICGIASGDSRVVGVKLSKNFGSFVACLAGLTKCTGDCAVIISADLQDPPELILQLYEEWLIGNKVVMAVREQRREGFLKVFFAQLFYRLFRLLVTKDMPRKGFDFVLI